MKTLTTQNSQQDYIEAQTTPSQTSLDTNTLSQDAADQIVSVASYLTVLGRTVAGMMLAAFLVIPFAPRLLAVGVLLAFHIVAMRTAAHLARALNRRPGVWVALMVFPLINVFATIRLSHLAVLALRRYGIKCSDLGVSRREMQSFGCADGNTPVETWRSKINA